MPLSPVPPSRPVVIAGGGPVGLTLAALLSGRGVRSTVIEADDGYCTGSRAICISRRSLEILAWAGAERHVASIGLPWVGGRSYFRNDEVLHFRMPSEPGERFAPMVNVQQYHVEEAAHRAIVDPDVRWSTRVTGVERHADGVRVETEGPDGRAVVDAAWLVACDGGRSTVRGALGLALEGVEYDGRYVIVDIEQDTQRDVERLAWFDPPSNPGSTILMHRQPGNVWRIDYQLRDDEDPVAAIEPANVLPRVASHLAMIGEDAPWTPLWISIYNAKCLTLPSYRHDRVLFAGDAAHLVPIFGVRGLNSGLDDAGNLAWKLAAVVGGDAPDTLLDSYSTERVHATRENIAYGAKSTEFMAPPNAGFRLMREAALRLAREDDTVAALINPRQSTPVAYVGSPLNVGGGPLVGRPAPDAALDGAPSHLSLLFGGRPVLLCFGDAARDAVDGVETATLARGRHPDAWSRYHAIDGTAVLVRPDGYVAAEWPTFDAAAIRAALAAIFRKEAIDVA